MGTSWCRCNTVYLYPPVSSNQLFHPLHGCFCHNPNRANWSGTICDFRKSLREFLDLVVNRFTRQTLPTTNKKHFFMNILCIEFCSQNTPNRTLLFGSILLKYGRHFEYWTCACPGLSWSWTVLLPSDTYREPLTSVTSVLLPCVTYLLILSHTLLGAII
jgi:hypothetical protein